MVLEWAGVHNGVLDVIEMAHYRKSILLILCDLAKAFIANDLLLYLAKVYSLVFYYWGEINILFLI